MTAMLLATSTSLLAAREATDNLPFAAPTSQSVPFIPDSGSISPAGSMALSIFAYSSIVFMVCGAIWIWWYVATVAKRRAAKRAKLEKLGMGLVDEQTCAAPALTCKDIERIASAHRGHGLRPPSVSPELCQTSCEVEDRATLSSPVPSESESESEVRDSESFDGDGPKPPPQAVPNDKGPGDYRARGRYVRAQESSGVGPIRRK